MTARHRDAPAVRPPGWSDTAFGRVADIVHLIAGLVFPPNRQPSAEAGMRRAMSALRISSPDHLAHAVERPGEARDAVLAELTVGETYFFREPAQLDVLRSTILPSLASRRDGEVPLRIWSAGCASGEEPFTLAMLLHENGWPHPARILGTDVARPRLEAARRGRYTRWSLRTVSDARTSRWFERRGPHFQLDQRIRDAVEFAPLNLIADEYPSASTGTLNQDIVLCRNVLIYFDMEAVVAIATRLLASLAPDGWLLLGASDPPLADLVPCEVVVTPGGIVYRRADRDPEREQRSMRAQPAETTMWGSPTAMFVAPPVHVEPIPIGPAPAGCFEETPAAKMPPIELDDLDPAFAAYRDADYPRAEALARDTVTRDPRRADQWILLVRSLANQGRLRDADEQCMRALDQHRLVPELHFLHSVLLTAASQHREAAIAARRALYLDGQFIMAQMQLGDALARLGEAARAARSFENAVRLLASVDDDEAVVAADGVSAPRLRQAAAARLQGIREEALA